MTYPGYVLAGRYVLRDQIGQGGMGSVWRAEHTQLSSIVAVKLIDPQLARSEDAVARFRREAKASAALRSPHVVQIFDYGVEQGVPFIAMELLDGESLASRLHRTHHLSAGDTSWVMTHVARAVSKAHEAGIVHRDLKPDNVFLVRNDDETIAKVLDFGIAKAMGVGPVGATSSRTKTGALMGTPYYMSPEQAQGTKAVDYRSDLWSLGVIAFECILGRRPFESDALGDLLLRICVYPVPVPSSVGPVPPGFDAWFAMACDRDPLRRFSSAREMAESLRAVLAGQPMIARATSPGYPSSPDMPAVQVATPMLLPTTDAGLAHTAQPAATTSSGQPRSKAPIVAAVVLFGIGAAAGIAFAVSRGISKPADEAAALALPAQSVSAATASAAPAVSSSAPVVAAAPEAGVVSIDSLPMATPGTTTKVASGKTGGKASPAKDAKASEAKPPAQQTAAPAAPPPPATKTGRNYGF
jgi:eukaryotic-like serine/threonine-protein kinase